MHDRQATTNPQRVKAGGPLAVVLVVDSAPLLLRMKEMVQSVAGLRLAGAFTDGAQAIDWLLWDRQGFHLAFVDLGLTQGSWQEVVARLHDQERAGTVVALGDHLWREVRERCAAHGIHHLLEKGDLVAFRSFLEDQAR
jgi:DNA-binding NarL/FixJ family response regulator